jgi:hypothetical protein
MKPDPDPDSKSHPVGFDFSHPAHCGAHSYFGPAMPQLDFPKFNGTNPKLWIKQCDTYFDLYQIPVENWVKLATVNFSGTAAFWMQTVELNVRKCSWDHLCQLVVDRFDRDQFNHFIRQFFHVKQTASVTEYIPCLMISSSTLSS